MSPSELITKILSRTRSLDSKVLVRVIESRDDEGCVTSHHEGVVSLVGNFGTDNVILCVDKSSMKKTSQRDLY